MLALLRGRHAPGWAAACPGVGCSVPKSRAEGSGEQQGRTKNTSHSPRIPPKISPAVPIKAFIKRWLWPKRTPKSWRLKAEKDVLRHRGFSPMLFSAATSPGAHLGRGETSWKRVSFPIQRDVKVADGAAGSGK